MFFDSFTPVCRGEHRCTERGNDLQRSHGECESAEQPEIRTVITILNLHLRKQKYTRVTEHTLNYSWSLVELEWNPLLLGSSVQTVDHSALQLLYNERSLPRIQERLVYYHFTLSKPTQCFGMGGCIILVLGKARCRYFLSAEPGEHQEGVEGPRRFAPA